MRLQRGNHGKALPALARARAAYLAGGPAERLLLEHQQANAWRRAGRLDAARAHWKALLVVAEAELGPEHELLAEIRLGLRELADELPPRAP